MTGVDVWSTRGVNHEGRGRERNYTVVLTTRRHVVLHVTEAINVIGRDIDYFLKPVVVRCGKQDAARMELELCPYLQRVDV